MGIVVTIAGTDRSDKIIFGSLRITDNLNQQIDTCEFKVEEYGAQTYKPTIGQVVVVTVDGTITYGGVIVEITQTRSAGKIAHAIRCKDYSQLLDKQLVTERYEDKTAEYIVDDLVANYTTDGFTTTNVGGALKTIKSIAFNEITVSACLNKLAALINYYWYVDSSKDIHFFAKSEEVAPFNLTDTSDNFIIDSLIIKDDISQLRNKVKIRGGDAVAAERTELLAGDGESDIFPLANKFSEKPVVKVGGTTKNVGIDYINQDADFDVMWSYGQKYIKFTAGNIPAAPGGGDTTNIEVIGLPLKPIVVEIVNGPSIALYGTYEFMKRDDTIKSRDEAVQYAQAELAAYAEKLRGGSFQTYTPGLRSGQTITINSATRGIADTFVIQSVKFSQITPTDYAYDVALATTKTLSMIDLLQQLLQKEEMVEGDDETLLNFFQLEDDSTITDEAPVVSHTTTEDYVYEDTPEHPYANAGIWDKATWG